VQSQAHLATTRAISSMEKAKGGFSRVAPPRTRRPSLDREAARGIATGHQTLAGLSPDAPHSPERTTPPPNNLRSAVSLKRSYSPFGRVDCRPERLVPIVGMPIPQVPLPTPFCL